MQHWASFSPEGKHIVCVSTNGHSCLRDGHTVDIKHTTPGVTNTVQQTLKSSLGTITILCLSFDGKYILIGTEDGYVSMSDITQGVLIWEAAGYHNMRNMAFSSHEDKVAIIVGKSDSPTRQVNFLERSTGKLLSCCH
ncbi:hypothetical protein SERLADRAFT_473282, partial [Serpula lacrymans var. lacrymans S7.9]